MENVYTEFHKNSTDSSVGNSRSQRVTPSRIRPPHRVFFTSSRKPNHEDYSLTAAMCSGRCVNLASCVEQPDLLSAVIPCFLQFSVTFVVVSSLVTPQNLTSRHRTVANKTASFPYPKWWKSTLLQNTVLQLQVYTAPRAP